MSRRKWLFGGGLVDKAHAKDGEDCPPETRHGNTDARRMFFGKSNFFVKGEDDESDGELQSSADVSVGVALGGDVIHLLFAGDVGKKGVVKDVCVHEADLRNKKKEKSLDDVAGLAEVKHHAEERAGVGEEEQELLLGRGEVGDGAQHRRADEADDSGEAHDETPQGVRAEGLTKDYAVTV